MQREDKERVVAELTERLRTAETLIVADYRGLTMPQIDGLRGRLLEHGARLSVVKNTLTRRAAEAAGADALLALLEGPSAIAFVESDSNAAAVAKALSEAARDTRILVVRGGVMNGRQISDAEVENLAKLPPLDVLRGQVVGVIVAPLTQLLALLNAPLQNLIGLIDARIEQLREQGDTGAPEAEVEASPPEAEAAADAEVEPAEAEADVEPAADAEPAAAEAEPEPAAEAPDVTAETATEHEPATPAAEAAAGTGETAEPRAEAEAPAQKTDAEDEEA